MLFATFLSEKLALAAEQVTLSLPTTPVRLQVTLAVVVPSKTLLLAVIEGVTVALLTVSVKLWVASVPYPLWL